MKKAQIVINMIASSVLLFCTMFVLITERFFTPLASKSILTAVLVLIEISIILGIIQKHQNNHPISSRIGAFFGILLTIIGNWFRF